MATVKKPRGRMTKPLVTPYEVGDAVLLKSGGYDDGRYEDGQYTDFTGELHSIPRVGKRIFISDPCDGDCNVPDVRREVARLRRHLPRL